MRAVLLVLSAVLGLTTLCSITDQPVRVQDLLYSIDNGSSLSIAGTSNINSFSCFCNETFTKHHVRITTVDSISTLRFSNAQLKLPTVSMDCNNSRMNSDLCDALKAQEYPYIVVDLHEVNLRGLNVKAAKNDWISVVAVATLTITNVCKPLVLDVQAQKIGPDRYRFVCSKDLRMTDFKVDPPTALFGLIKVHNEIKINFDLYTTLSSN